MARCNTCESYFILDPPDKEDLGKFYPRSAGVYNDAYGTRRRIVSSINGLVCGHRCIYDDIPRMLPREGHSFALDVGAGAGLLSTLLSSIGWSVLSSDSSSYALESLKKNELRCIRSNAELPPFRDEAFDLVIMSQVIEHLYAPRESLVKYFRTLKHGGIIVIGTPNGASLSHALFGPYWTESSVPRHLTIFSSRRLRALLGEVGFSHVTISTTFHPSFGRSLWDASHRSDSGSHTLRDLLAAGLLPLDMLSKMLGRGNGLVATAVKS